MYISELRSNADDTSLLPVGVTTERQVLVNRDIVGETRHPQGVFL